MLKNLADIFDKESRLVGVSYALFEGAPHFVTAVEMRFESFSANFRAISDDDTLEVNLGELKPETDELLTDVSRSTPWSQCVGARVPWLWRLTNQQGYNDGVRIEFTKPDTKFTSVVELIVMASAIKVFLAEPYETA